MKRKRTVKARQSLHGWREQLRQLKAAKVELQMEGFNSFTLPFDPDNLPKKRQYAKESPFHAGKGSRKVKYRLKLSPFWRDAFCLGFPDAKGRFIDPRLRKVNGQLVKLPKSLQRALFDCLAPKGEKVFRVTVFRETSTFSCKGFHANIRNDSAVSANLEGFLFHRKDGVTKKEEPSYAVNRTTELLRAKWKRERKEADNYILRDMRIHGEIS